MRTVEPGDADGLAEHDRQHAVRGGVEIEHLDQIRSALRAHELVSIISMNIRSRVYEPK